MKRNANIIRSAVLSVAIILLCIYPLPSMAVNFPTRPVTLIVPFAPGGGTDIVLRALADTTSKYLGQPVIIENKAGGAATVGPATMAANAKPDGYTISAMLITVFRYPHIMKVTFDPLKDFTYIMRLSGYDFGLVVRKDAPWKTFNEFISYAKANPNKVSYAHPGPGSSAHIAMEMFALKQGIKWIQVPTKGAMENIPALLGGHVSASVTDPGGFAAHVNSGDIRLLATFGEKRIKKWPNVPTVKELGYDFVSNSPLGLAGPKGMDPSVVRILQDAFKKGMEDPAFVKVLDKFNMENLYMNTEDYQNFVKVLAQEVKESMEKLGLAKKKKN